MSTELSMFERMLLLPMFQGLSQDDLCEVLAHTRLDFRQLEPGECITTQDESLTQVYFVIKGTIRAEYVDNTKGLELYEHIASPYVIESWNIYGIQQKFQRSYYAETPCALFCIEKKQFKMNLMKFNIIATNHINTVTNLLHKLNAINLAEPPYTIQAKIAHLIQTHCIAPDEPYKRLIISMNTLSKLLSETRLKVSNTLHLMENDDTLKITYRGFEIPDFKKLYNKYCTTVV